MASSNLHVVTIGTLCTGKISGGVECLHKIYIYICMYKCLLCST